MRDILSFDVLSKRFFNLVHRYKDQFGFVLPNRPIIVDDIRIRALAKSGMSIDRKIDQRPENKPLKETKVYSLDFNPVRNENRVFEHRRN